MVYDIIVNTVSGVLSQLIVIAFFAGVAAVKRLVLHYRSRR